MKKETAYLWLSVGTFAIGFWVSFPYHWLIQWRSNTWELDQYRRSAMVVEQGIYGENHWHVKGIDPASDAQLGPFDPVTSQGFIALNIGGTVWEGATTFKLFGNGELFEEADGRRKLVTTLAPRSARRFSFGFSPAGS